MDDLLTTFWAPAGRTGAAMSYERHAVTGLQLEGRARRVSHLPAPGQPGVVDDVLVFDVQPGHGSAPAVPVELWMRTYPDWLAEGAHVRVSGVLAGGTLCASMVEKSETGSGRPARMWVRDATAALCRRRSELRQT